MPKKHRSFLLATTKAAGMKCHPFVSVAALACSVVVAITVLAINDLVTIDAEISLNTMVQVAVLSFLGLVVTKHYAKQEKSQDRTFGVIVEMLDELIDVLNDLQAEGSSYPLAAINAKLKAISMMSSSIGFATSHLSLPDSISKSLDVTDMVRELRKLFTYSPPAIAGSPMDSNGTDDDSIQSTEPEKSVFPIQIQNDIAEINSARQAEQDTHIELIKKKAYNAKIQLLQL